MKVLILLTLFTLSQILLISCDNIPRGRPNFTDLEAQVAGGDDDDDDEELEIPERPSGAIVVQAEHCGCKSGVAITLGNCEQMCSEKQGSNDSVEKVFFSVELTEAITLDIYEDVYGWCKQEILDPNTNLPVATGVGCVVEVKNQNGDVVDELAFAPGAGQLDFSLDISSLDNDETYRLTIVETTSNARSTTFQVRKFSNLMSGPSGPLQLMPIDRYTCMLKDWAVVNGQYVVNSINRFYLYFNSETRPEPLQASTIQSTFCHDIETYGPTPINSPLLEETAGAFTLWFKDDPRFFDLDGDSNLDINQLIYQEATLQGFNLPGGVPDIFSPLSWISAFDDSDITPGGDGGSGNSITVVNKELGYFMQAFLDSTTYKSYCPTQQHYYSTNGLFRAMRDLVGVDTEALYIAKEDNVSNFLLIKESTVSDIWFYIEGGQHIEPTTDTIQGKQIQFYWPADPSSPFIKKSHQKVFTIKSAAEISDLNGGNANQSSSGVRTNYPTHDKRMGCVPVLGL